MAPRALAPAPLLRAPVEAARGLQLWANRPRGPRRPRHDQSEPARDTGRHEASADRDVRAGTGRRDRPHQERPQRPHPLEARPKDERSQPNPTKTASPSSRRARIANAVIFGPVGELMAHVSRERATPEQQATTAMPETGFRRGSFTPSRIAPRKRTAGMRKIAASARSNSSGGKGNEGRAHQESRRPPSASIDNLGSPQPAVPASSSTNP